MTTSFQIIRLILLKMVRFLRSHNNRIQQVVSRRKQVATEYRPTLALDPTSCYCKRHRVNGLLLQLEW